MTRSEKGKRRAERLERTQAAIRSLRYFPESFLLEVSLGYSFGKLKKRRKMISQPEQIHLRLGLPTLWLEGVYEQGLGVIDALLGNGRYPCRVFVMEAIRVPIPQGMDRAYLLHPLEFTRGYQLGEITKAFAVSFGGQWYLGSTAEYAAKRAASHMKELLFPGEAPLALPF